ncbi:hypothetical protein [Streptosporangium sandarakinum]|uniref:hypothetical protein n=1 Tax=Streptosporangium sandarakinum TaxID=1260955 RepID=UPI0033A10562
MTDFTDPARPGRIRRLAVTVAAPLLVPAVSYPLVAWYGTRLPDRAYLDGGRPEYASTWDGWLSGQFHGFLIVGAFCVLVFVHYWRWPGLQRLTATLLAAVCAARAVSDGARVTLLIDAAGPVPQPTWLLGVELAALVIGGLLGWVLSGPLPAPLTTSDPPPPAAHAMALTPEQRAVFTASSWMRWPLLGGTVSLCLAALVFVWDGERPELAVILALNGLFTMLQTRVSLQIDRNGVHVTFPLLGNLGRSVPYATVRFAEVRSTTSGARLGLFGGSRGWGYVGGRGPVLALVLADGREFLYSTRDAETAAELVNGALARERQGAGSADHG